MARRPAPALLLAAAAVLCAVCAAGVTGAAGDGGEAHGTQYQGSSSSATSSARSFLRSLVPEPLTDDGPDASNCTMAYVAGADDPCQAAKDNCPPFGSVLNYLELRFCTFGGKVSHSGTGHTLRVTGLQTLFYSLLAMWVVALFYVLGDTADTYFCPVLARLSTEMGLSPNLAGITFLALGNGAPDIASILIASFQGSAQISYGEPLGAGVFVTTAVVAAVVIAVPVVVPRRPFMRDAGFYVAVVATALYIRADGVVSVAEAAFMLSLYLLYIAVVVVGEYVYRRHLKPARMRREGLTVTPGGDGYEPLLAADRMESGEAALKGEGEDGGSSRDSSDVEDDEEGDGDGEPQEPSRSSSGRSAGSAAGSDVSFASSALSGASSNASAPGTPPPKRRLKRMLSLEGMRHPTGMDRMALLQESFTAVTGRPDRAQLLPSVSELRAGFDGSDGGAPGCGVRCWEAAGRSAAAVARGGLRGCALLLSASRAPFDLLRRASIPQMEEGEFSKPWTVLAFFLTPLLAATITDSSFLSADPALSLSILLGTGAAAAGIAFFMLGPLGARVPGERPGWDCLPPRAGAVLARAMDYLVMVVAFLGCIGWLYMTANELVGVLQSLGMLLNVSPVILSITVLAWGNSIGDLVSDVVVARKGLVGMAIGAIYAGPMLNLAFGLGLALTLQAARSGSSIDLTGETEADKVLIWISGGTLLFSLISAMVIIPANGFRAPRWFAAWLLVTYVAYMLAAMVAGALAFAAAAGGVAVAAERSDAEVQARLAAGFAGLAGCVGVGSGAFGFHGLPRMLRAMGRGDLEKWQKIWNIGVHYSLMTSAGLVGLAALPSATPGRKQAIAGLAAGVPLFSWSIQAYVITGAQAFQLLTPFGGLSMMAGWGSLFVAAALGGSGDALEARAELDKLVGYQAPPAAEVAADDSLRTEPN